MLNLTRCEDRGICSHLAVLAYYRVRSPGSHHPQVRKLSTSASEFGHLKISPPPPGNTRGGGKRPLWILREGETSAPPVRIFEIEHETEVTTRARCCLAFRHAPLFFRSRQAIPSFVFWYLSAPKNVQKSSGYTTPSEQSKHIAKVILQNESGGELFSLPFWSAATWKRETCANFFCRFISDA